MIQQIENYVTLKEASEETHYSILWIRQLCKKGRIQARRIGTGHRSVWLVYLPSLFAHIEEMNRLGTKKHTRGREK